MNKKGQAAMEFLMTYGWAILVVLAAIGALAYFGVLSPDRFMPSKCMVSGGFSCIEFKMAKADPTSAQTVSFYLQNNLGVDATWLAVSLTDNDNNCTPVADPAYTVVTVGDTIYANVTTGLTNGQKSAKLTFDGTTCVTTQSSFRGTVTVIYLRDQEAESHTAGGSISGRFD